MRIHKIRFENLNSLLGQWEIDFNDPSYVSEGIFAISGPTGAGKTTLLDALCLALYGQTPRLDKITKASNEIMSRQAGSCFAEVTFETSAGLFCATWRQHRARSRPGGELQQPRHELVNAANGAVLESRLRDVMERIISVTGMDFQRFTRSMLLAQGNFAAFLQAGSDERAPILEQITGTEIYTTISQGVHKRHALEQTECQALNAKVQHLSLLSPEEVRAQEAELQSLNAAALAGSAELAQLVTAVQWRQNLTLLQAEAERLNSEESKLSVRQQAFQPEAERLRLALKALELDGDFRELESLRAQQITESAEKVSLEQALPKLQSSQNNLRAALEQAQGALRTAQEHEQSGHVLFQEVRLLDSRLSECQAQHNKLEAESKSQQLEHAKALRDLENNREQKAQQQAKLAAVQAELTARASDAPLVSELSGLRQQFQSVENLAQALDVLEQQKAMLEQQVQATSLSLKAASNAAKQSATECQSKGQECEQLEEALEKLLASPFDPVSTEEASFWEQVASCFGHSNRGACQPFSAQLFSAPAGNLAWWRHLLENLKDRADALNDFSAALYRLHKQNKTLTELNSQNQELTQSQERHQTVLAEQIKVCASREENVALWEAQSLAAAKIADLEQERHYLQAHQPCPLCGSLEHPFANPAAVPENADKTKIAWQQARELLRTAENALRESKISVATNQAQARMVGEQHEKSLKLYAEEQNSVLEAWQALGHCMGSTVPLPALVPANSLWPLILEKQVQETLRAWQTCVQVRLKACQNLVEQAEQKVSLREQAQKNLAPLELRFQEQQKKAEQAERARALLLQKQKSENQNLELAQARHQAALKLAQEGAAPYVPDTSALGTAALPTATLLAQLGTRRDSWQAAVQVQEQVTKNAHNLALTHEKLTESAHGCAQKQAQLDKNLVSSLNTLKALQAERAQLFADRQLDVESKILRQAVLMAEQAQQRVSQQEQGVARDLEAQKQLLGNLEQRLKSRATVLCGLEQGFARRLEAQSFMASPNLFATLERSESSGLSGLSGLSEPAEFSAQGALTAEAAYHAAQLPEVERKNLETRSAALVLEQANLVERRREHAQRFQEESARELSLLSMNELEKARLACAQKLELSQQKVGAVQQNLENHARQLETQRAQVQALLAQKVELERWGKLHNLIGSDSGKKFRNFAQGLTFDQVIHHANRQLCKMNDRYILLRDTEQPLDLNVVDLYQAGEIRSTRNLSGGESFLVSLALALGLSQMASRNVRVDSLFLDEGFGTLDEDALETALSSLASLRQQGKLIGLISHVPAIRERLSVQIQVRPGPNGCSIISGPGVRGIGLGSA